MPIFCSLEEFNNLLVNADLLNDNFGSREVGIQYNLSMQTRVNEIDEDRHLKMTFTEFIDAIGRIADKVEITTEVIEQAANLDMLQAFKENDEDPSLRRPKNVTQ